jgi:CRP-like cAMP-binding protein
MWESLLPIAENRLIELLPRKDRRHFLSVCEPVELQLQQILWERGQLASHVYFPTMAFVSLVILVDAKSVLEVGMVGAEGMLGGQAVLAGVIAAPLRAIVQGAGAAWRIDVVAFRREVLRSAALRSFLDRYLYVLATQLATSAACARFHLIGPRLARRLLMTQDRAHSDGFCVTQEFLSDVLGVRRVGITAAAGALQRNGLISYRRGELFVLDRLRLEAAACSCYASDRKTYADILH